MVYAGAVCAVVVVVLGDVAPAVQLLGARELAAAEGSRGDRTRVHERDGRHLAVVGLGAFAVGEVARGVPDGKRVVGGRVSSPEAGAAKRGAHDGACVHQVGEQPLAVEADEHGLARGVDGQVELAVADVRAFERVGGLDDVGVGATRAAGDDALLRLQPAVVGDLVEQREARASLGDFLSRFLGLAQDVFEVCVELVDLVDVGRVERQRDHGLDGGEVHVYAAVVVGDVGGVQVLEVIVAVVLEQVLARVVVGAPHARQARRLGRHDVDAVAVVGRHRGDARTDELHDLVLDVAAFVDGTDDGERDVLRADEGLRGAVEVDGDDAGVVDVVGVAEQLLVELAAAFPDGHRAKRAIARVAVGTQDHLAAAGKVLAHVLVDDGDVRRDVDAAVLFGGGKAEEVVVVVDRAADCAQRIVAAGEHVGQGELVHAARTCRLDDAHVRDVVRCHRVELELQVLHRAGLIVFSQNLVGNRPFGIARLVSGVAREVLDLRRLVFGENLLAVNEENALVVELDHHHSFHVALWYMNPRL